MGTSSVSLYETELAARELGSRAYPVLAAGQTMAQVVQSIQRLSTLVGQISTASQEQANGVTQVGEAVTALDQVTQQNAALVEQMAAAADGLSSQAQGLVQAVAVFRAGDGGACQHRNEVLELTY